MTGTTEGKYNRIGTKKGPLVIGGAYKKMDEDATFTYVPMFKVAGPLEEVKVWLKDNHSDRMKEALNGSYNKTTIKNKSVREAFDREVEAAAENRLAAATTKEYESQIDLRILGTLLRKYEEQSKEGGFKTQDNTGPDMKTKLKEIIADNKVLDITFMKKKGTEGKKTEFKEGSSKRRLSQMSGEPLYNVVYNPKNTASVDGVKHFLTLYGGFEQSAITKNVKAVRNGEILNIGRGKSPVKSPLLSPSRRSRKRSPSRKDEVEELLEDLGN